MLTVGLAVNKHSALSLDQVAVRTHFLDGRFGFEGSDWAQELSGGGKHRVAHSERLGRNTKARKRPRDSSSDSEHDTVGVWRGSEIIGFV